MASLKGHKTFTYKISIKPQMADDGRSISNRKMTTQSVSVYILVSSSLRSQW